MTEPLQDRKPGLSSPLKLMAASAAGAILSFGLCTVAMRQGHQYWTTITDIGMYGFAVSVLAFVVSVGWFLVQLVRQASYSGRNNS